MGLKRAILVLGEPKVLAKGLQLLEQGPYALMQEPWPVTRAELVKVLKALTEQWTVVAILLLDGRQFHPLNEEIFAPFMPSLQLVCGIGAGE